MDRFKDLQRRSEALLPATSPIYSQAAGGQVEAVGTGIFFRHGDRHFVLSAAHVFRRMKEESLLIGDTHLVPLNGRFFSAPMDDIDLGFVPLNADQFEAMCGARFLSADDLNVSDRPELEPDGHRFYVVGFRADTNAPDGVPTAVESNGAAYLAHSAPETKYRDLGLSPERNLALLFNRNILYSGVKIFGPEEEPQGLSGSGVWQFTASVESDKLVSILIEHSERHKAIITTRMRPLLDALALYADGVIG